jgi:hypothetical protein
MKPLKGITCMMEVMAGKKLDEIEPAHYSELKKKCEDMLLAYYVGCEMDNFIATITPAADSDWYGKSKYTPPASREEKPLPIYPVQDEENLYKLSYKYVEAPSEISPWKPTVKQLQFLIEKYRRMKNHPDNEDTLELTVFLWALRQYEMGQL